MAMQLKGASAAAALSEALQHRVEELKKKGVLPCLAIVRIGEREDDLAYERGAMKRCEKVGVALRREILSADASQEDLMAVIEKLNADESVHGVLMFCPLPKGLDEAQARRALDPRKDMDGITASAMAMLYSGDGEGYPPCTAEACLALLRHYQIPLEGKKVTVVGRSLVIGKPAAMLLLAENATVTLCHSRSGDLRPLCREADIVIAAAGKMGLLGAEHLREGQVVLDVGIHVGADGKLCGDVCYDEAEPLVAAITPVPGGVGAVTTTILAEHVISAAEKTLG